jgi:S-DNA-T family DNA segregation ATPase FtsK/SpoIIIE
MVRSEPKRQHEADPWAELIEDSLIPVTIFLGHLAWWAALFPMFSIPLVGAAVLIAMGGYVSVVVYFAIVLLLLGGWAVLSPESWSYAVTDRWRPRWRHWYVYRRRWASICALNGLGARLDEKVLIPGLRHVSIGSDVDTLEVKMLAGQTVEQWHRQSDALAHAFRALALRVRPLRPGAIFLEVQHSDRLAEIVALPNSGQADDLRAVTIGRTEAGQPWRIPILYRHLLIAGATGAGKGSVIWSILAALGPSIQDGLASVRVIDPKGGMELGVGAPLFDDFAHDAGEGTLAVLRNAAETMKERANRLRGKTRLHVPTVEEPLIVVIVDEMATLTAYGSNRKAKAVAEQLLGLLLSQGRAVGVTVIGALQDPSKEVMSLRQLFPIRVALRLAEASQVTMVLGPGARDRGAHCDEIPDTLPGVGYVAQDGTAELIRVRACHVTDHDVDQLVKTYRRRTGAIR